MSQEDYIKQLEMTVASLHKCLEHSNKDLDEALKGISERDIAIELLHMKIASLEKKVQVVGYKAREMAAFNGFTDYGPADRIAHSFEDMRRSLERVLDDNSK